MPSAERSALALLLVTALSLFARVARAEDPVGRFSKLLAEATDFRVRTQAALALGAAKQQGAVRPLCGGLSDSSAAVRVAAATALRRLNLGGAECLTQRLALEENQLAKSAIARALETVGSPEAARPVLTERARYYVSIGSFKGLPPSPTGGLEQRITAWMRRSAPDTFAFAPTKETPQGAQALLAQHPALKGFYLAPKLSAVYAGGNLTVKIDVAMFTYPAKALLGSYSVRGAQSGLLEDDVGGRDDLIKVVAEGAMMKFAKAAAGL